MRVKLKNWNIGRELSGGKRITPNTGSRRSPQITRKEEARHATLQENRNQQLRHLLLPPPTENRDLYKVLLPQLRQQLRHLLLPPHARGRE